MWSRRLLALGREQEGSLAVMIVIGLTITATYFVQTVFVATALGEVMVNRNLSGVVPLCYLDLADSSADELLPPRVEQATS